MRSFAPLSLSLSLACVALATACPPEVPPDDFQGWELEQLAPEAGFSIRIPPYEVPLGGESQRCYFFNAPDLNNGEPYYLNRVHTAMNPGSHHLNVFRVNTILAPDPANPSVGLGPDDGVPMDLNGIPATMVDGVDDYQDAPCWNSANWADWPLVANSQNSTADNPYTDWQLPENVGIKIMPGERLMIQPHYVNYGQQRATHGSDIGINFHRFGAGVVPLEMGSLFATQQSIRVCQSTPSATFSGTCRFPAGDVTVAAANGHFHSRGKEFRVYPWDGVTADHPAEEEQFYISEDWNHPPMDTDIGVNIASGGGIWWDCQYEWQDPHVGDDTATCDDVDAKDSDQAGDCCYTFGGNTDVGEHCNLFLYYYPASQDVFCN